MSIEATSIGRLPGGVVSAAEIGHRLALEDAQARAKVELQRALARQRETRLHVARLDEHEVRFRLALAQRDIGHVYRALQGHGVSQRRIAAATGQSQSEISEILSGRRVVAYDVLVRIADGLTVERGKMGLAYDGETLALIEAAT